MDNLKVIKLHFCIVLILINDLIAFGQIIKSSPCPQYFQYMNDGYEYYGFMELPNPPIGTSLKVNLVLSAHGRLPNNYPGSIELNGSREQAFQRVRNNLPLQYIVKFPPLQSLPSLTQILYNNRVICSGVPERGHLITTIRLEHTFFTQSNMPLNANAPFNGPQINSNNFDFGNEYDINNSQYGIIDNFDNPVYIDENRHDNPQSVRPSLERPQSGSPPLFGRPMSPAYPQLPQTVPNSGIQIQRPQETSQRPDPPPQIQNVRPPQPNQPPHPTTISNTQPINLNARPLSEICGKTDSRFNFRPLVIGGQQIERGSWPWLVAIYLNLATSLSFQCGGTLVSSRVVISAAHCFYVSQKKYSENDIILHLGRHNIRNWNEAGFVIATPQSIQIHPKYDKDLNTFDADIAVILLRDEARFSEYIRPACMWTSPPALSHIEGKQGIVVGWGRDENGQITTPEPRRASATVVPETTCIRSNEQFRILTSNRTFCAGNKDGTGPCTGDSGGGFLIYDNDHWILRGLVSASLADQNSNACDLNEYVIYNDVAMYVDWIGIFAQFS